MIPIFVADGMRVINEGGSFPEMIHVCVFEILYSHKNTKMLLFMNYNFYELNLVCSNYIQRCFCS